MDDCKNYFLETGRRVSFEYTLLGIYLSVPGESFFLSETGGVAPYWNFINNKKTKFYRGIS
jgi:adenine C2-methylase RlmN of 23S rRNA A2503 and tRNA A37